jgi:hypothetical protein
MQPVVLENRQPSCRPSSTVIFEHNLHEFPKKTFALKGYRQNWQETAPGEEKVNQLLNTSCNK